MTRIPKAFDDQGFMDALLNVVIPPSADGSVPGAGEVGLSGAVASGLRADPLLGPMVEPGIEAIRDEALARQGEGLAGMAPEEGRRLVEGLLAAHPVLMMGLLRYLYPAYYAHPLVLAGIGEAARPPFPEGFEVEPTDPALLERLEARRKTG